MITGTYDELRSRGQREPALARQDDAGALGAAEVVLLSDLLEGFGTRYREAKRSRGAVDFDDLELEAGELLSAHAEVRASWTERFEMIMVDELQDTNARQIALLAALDRDNLFTVGDEHQSIYGFRHADVEIFRERGERLAQLGAAGALRTNFRSVAPLLAATGAIFARALSRALRPAARRAGTPPVERAGARAAARRPRRLGGPRGASGHRARARTAVAPRGGASACEANRRADRSRSGGPRGGRRAASRGDPDRRVRGGAGRPRARHARDGGRRLLSSAPRSSTSSRTCAFSPTRLTISRSTECSPRRCAAPPPTPSPRSPRARASAAARPGSCSSSSPRIAPPASWRRAWCSLARAPRASRSPRRSPRRSPTATMSATSPACTRPSGASRTSASSRSSRASGSAARAATCARSPPRSRPGAPAPRARPRRRRPPPARARSA